MPIVTDLELPGFDYSAADLTAEIYHRRLAEVAEHGWLAQSPLSYVVLDRESGEFFLRSRATAFPGREIAELFGITSGPLWDQIDSNIINQSGDRHRRLRALVGPAFTPRAADRWRPSMRRFLHELWDEGASSCEFVTALAKPYSSLTTAAVLGVPLEDAPKLHAWSSWVQRQFDIRALASDVVHIERAITEVRGYVEDLLGGKRADRFGDLMSTLLAAEIDGDRLSHAECVELVLNVLTGGVETTQAQLAHGLRLFAAHPSQWAALAGDPELAGRAADEVLRFEPITPFTARICVEQVEYRGVVFPPGTIVAICAERANRETGAGERFDISAERDGRLLTFGAGAHYCLGANLARAELEEALAFLAPRMPDLAPGGPAELDGVEGIYAVESLPLTWAAPDESDAPHRP